MGGHIRTAIAPLLWADYALGSCGDGLGDNVSAVEVPLESMTGTVGSTAEDVSRFAGRNTSNRAKIMPRMIQ
jgi:hypothetical protein